ncbi:MAG TPA: 5'-3' exonuclease H3TH domain-containing protein, partial [Burkholderiaceae bacterium]|nr:5'-3' exonuclease H3TH domain-containing protein [Burkholderiaceae bacterium]
MKTLLLLDGSSYLYRAYHALPDLRTAAGEPTGALRGFISMLRTLRQQVPADYLACVFDAKGKTFRDELYAEYKANRAAMPEDLVAQIAPIHEAARALGWPVIEIEGIEADDVIGTLARYAAQHGLRTVISTGDKDLAQLVDERTTLVNTMSGETLDVPGVEAKFGVPPTRIVDYLTLVGDSVDNVPGVEKVGPKTAAKWLQTYGSLDAVVERAGEIGGVVGDNLRKALPWLPTARTLVTVRTDCDLAPHVPDLAALAMREEDPGRLRELYGRYEFKSWLREIGAADAAEAPAASAPANATNAAALRPEYETVLTREQLAAWLQRIGAAELTCVDTETTSLDPMAARLVGLSLSIEPLRACYIPLAHRYASVPEQLPFEATLEALRPWLESPHHRKVGQHLKYDMHVFANHGLKLAGVAHDTLLESYVIEAHRSHDMDSLAERHLGRKTITFTEVCGKGANQLR